MTQIVDVVLGDALEQLHEIDQRSFDLETRELRLGERRRRRRRSRRRRHEHVRRRDRQADERHHRLAAATRSRRRRSGSASGSRRRRGREQRSGSRRRSGSPRRRRRSVQRLEFADHFVESQRSADRRLSRPLCAIELRTNTTLWLSSE